ncbi:YPDG domain-containing protein, partial [Streptococcus pseudopneumoniae]|uniref:YPDG domain-containing protein n=2 Tax=Streptococcus pseudopneumoniae TaxID=257758 RepID=UPI0006D6A80F
MEDKSNSLSRVKRHQREKVLRFSIRKYSFGAASVAVAALMFMGANVVSADSPSQNTSSSTTGLASPKDGEQSSEAGQARDENQAEVASEPSANKEAQPAEEKAATVDSSRLSKLMEEVSALLSTDSKHDPSVVSPIKERLQKGKELLARADAGQGDLDSLAEKLEKDLAVLSSSSKEESQPQASESADKNASSERSDHKEEGSDRAASASVPEDKPKKSRRSKRALEPIPNTVNEGALSDVRYFASVDPSTNKGQNTRNDDPDFTSDKTVIRANFKEENGQKWMVYDVFFNNDGKRMVSRSYQQQYYFQAPFNIMHSSNTVKDLSFTRYKKFDGRRLSDGNIGFQKYGETAFIDKQWEQKPYIFNNDYISLYDPRSGVTRDNQRWDVFKNNQENSVLNTLTKKPDGKYPDLSYYLGIKVGEQSIDYAVHMHAKIRLKDDVTADEAARYGHVYAATTTYGKTTNQSYIVGALGARLETTTEAETYPIKGSSHTKTVGDSLPNTDNPVGDGYITSKSGKDFPSGMNWNWEGGRKPSTDQAGVFTYKVIATYSDQSSSENANSGSDGTVKLTVKPKKPTITGFENKKGLTGQQLTVNVGSGVPKGSKVNIYDGTKLIGTGTTDGETATVTVEGALPGSPITAETIVNNGGEVKSERSDAVTPTEAPDKQAPTLTITPASQTVTEGEWVTFTVTATDDKKAKLDVSDILTKYGDRFNTGKAFVDASGTTDTNQIRKITLKALPEDVGTHTITFKATDEAGHSAEPVTFTFTVTAGDKTGPTITAADATVTKNEPITPIPVTAVDNTGGVGLRDNNPIEVSNLPQGLKYENGKITGTTNAATGFYTVKIKAYDKNNNSSEKTIKITVEEQASKYNPTGETLTVPYNHNITDDEVKAKVQNFAPGTLTVQSKPSTNTSGNVGNAVVKVTYPDGSHDTVNIPVVVGRPNKDDYTPKYNDGNGKPGTKVEIPLTEENGKKIPTGTTFESDQPGVITVDKDGKVTVTIPKEAKPGDKITGKVTVTYPDGSKEEVPVTVTVGEQDKDIYTPKYEDGNGKPGTKVEIPLTEENGKKIPDGTTFESGTPGITVDKDGKVTVTIPKEAKPGDKITGKVTVTYPDGSKEEVPVTVTVGKQDKDIYTPKYNDGNGKPGTEVKIPLTEENGKKIPTGTTFESGTPGITVDKDGKVTVTIPKEAKPGDKITGKVTVTYPDGSKEEVPVKVTVTTPARKTPTVELSQDPTTGDVTVTPKKPDGSTYPEGTIVELPGKDGRPIKVTIGADGSAKVPNDQLPDTTVVGNAKITEPGKAAVEVPNVTTPAKVT